MRLNFGVDRNKFTGGDSNYSRFLMELLRNHFELAFLLRYLYRNLTYAKTSNQNDKIRQQILNKFRNDERKGF